MGWGSRKILNRGIHRIRGMGSEPEWDWDLTEGNRGNREQTLTTDGNGWHGFEEKVLTAELASQARHDFGAPAGLFAARIVVADHAELGNRADRKMGDRKIFLRVVFLA